MTIDVKPAHISSINRRLRALEKFGRDQKTFNASVTRKFDAVIRNNMAVTIRIDRLERKVDALEQKVDAGFAALNERIDDLTNKIDKLLMLIETVRTENAATQVGLERVEKRTDRLEAKVGV